MRKHNFGYFFREGLSNMFSHGFMSFAAIGITVACLLIMGTFSLVAVNANALLRSLESENEMLAYVDDDYTEDQAQAHDPRAGEGRQRRLRKYISKEEAMQSFQAQYSDEQMFENLKPEISETASPSM
jgi:cell division transport system permease protein